MRWVFAAAVAALVLVPPALAGGPSMRVGATEDAVKSSDPMLAKVQMDLLRLAGFDSVRITQFWGLGQTTPDTAELNAIRNVVTAARLDGVEVYVSVSNFGSRTTPLTETDRAQFAAYTAAVARALPTVRHFVIGNEPNLNRFWLPQFGPNGEDVAAPAYGLLLAAAYDALKAVSPKIEVIGVALSPRGGDRPNTGRDTHSPTVFIQDLGIAYRASGRTAPIMDTFAIHPYGDTSSQAPKDSAHPATTTIGLADYTKLVALLGQAFDGTGQPGSTLPILYDEFGVESLIPAPQAALYTGTEPATTKPVDEATQAAYYGQAIALAFCQPNVRGILLFHAIDEPALDRWQSGVYYEDDSPKSSLPAVRDAAAQARRGIIAACDGLQLTPKLLRARFPTSLAAPATTILCDIDCTYDLRLVKLGRNSTTAARRGRAIGRATTKIALPIEKLAPGTYRLVLTVRAPVNPGESARRTSAPYHVRPTPKS